jgi:hypothetical protein
MNFADVFSKPEADKDHETRLQEGAHQSYLSRNLGGGLRFCVDYRALNAVTIKNR